MFTQDYEWYIRHLTGHTDLRFSEVLFVEDIATRGSRHLSNTLGSGIESLTLTVES